MLLGRPRDLADQSLFRSVSLVAFLAWVGLGADGLSSSCYGPSEAFAHLREHSYLALFLGMAIAATVFIIASCYSHIVVRRKGGSHRISVTSVEYEICIGLAPVYREFFSRLTHQPGPPLVPRGVVKT